MKLVPVEESAALRVPAEWPPPLFAAGDEIPDERQFVIAEGGAALGMIALGPPGARVEIGYAIVEAQRNRGLATQAVALAVQLAFADPQTQDLFARVRPAAAASMRVLQKNGFARAAERDGFVVFTRRRR